MRFLIIFLFLLPVVSAWEITEIMYDPEGNDNNREYIELFTNTTNLTDVFFEDLASSDILTLVQSFDSPYALVVEEGFNSTDLNITIYTTGATLGNGLNNEEDLVLFRTNTSILDAVFYSSSRDGARNNGKALCVHNHLLLECTPTPGRDNDLNQIQEAHNYTLLISEFLPNPKGDDRAPRPNGEWIELYNHGQETVDLRGLLLQDARNTTFTISDVAVNTPLLPPESYGVVYLQGHLSLNNDGFEIIRLLAEDTVLDETSYSFSKEGLTWSKDLKQQLFVLAYPTPGAAYVPEDINLTSSLFLERAYLGNDAVVRFGESFRVRLQVRKGDTEKTTIKVFVENLSKQTTVSVAEKFVNHTFTLTIPLLPNCHGQLDDGIYLVRAEGLDTITSLPITLKGTAKDSCIVVEREVSKQVVAVKEPKEATVLHQETTKTQSDNFINVTERIVYESSDYKARRWAVYFFCFTLLLMVAVLLAQH